MSIVMTISAVACFLKHIWQAAPVPLGIRALSFFATGQPEKHSSTPQVLEFSPFSYERSMSGFLWSNCHITGMLYPAFFVKTPGVGFIYIGDTFPFHQFPWDITEVYSTLSDPLLTPGLEMLAAFNKGFLKAVALYASVCVDWQVVFSSGDCFLLCNFK